MLTNNEAFDAMADLRRRQLLVDLLHADPQAIPTLSSVSQEVLQAHESLLREYLSGPQEIENVAKATIRTHHVHLPKLVQYSYIDWNHDDSVVTKGASFDDVRPLLEVVEKEYEDTPTIVPELSIQK